MVALLLGFTQFRLSISSVSWQSMSMCSNCNTPEFNSRLDRRRPLYDNKKDLTHDTARGKQDPFLSNSFPCSRTKKYLSGCNIENHYGPLLSTSDKNVKCEWISICICCWPIIHVLPLCVFAPPPSHPHLRSLDI